jgi:hypothetical protein
LIRASVFALLLGGLLEMSSAKLVKSWEGFLGGTPIWMDLEIPDGDGKMRGSYYYKHVGIPLRLEGFREEFRFVLQEKTPQGKVTGSFELGWNDEDDSVYGMWSKSTWKNEFEKVSLARAVPSDRRFAVHRYDRLFTDGAHTLKAEIAGSRGEFGGRGDVLVTFDQKAILSIGVKTWISDGNDKSITSWFLFDLGRKRRIRLEEEMDPRGSERFKQVLHPLFDAALRDLRTKRKDPEWEAALSGWSPDSAFWADTASALDSVFSASRYDPWSSWLTEVHLDADSIYMGTGGRDFFNLYPIDMRKYEHLEFAIPVLELIPCLKPGSILRNLARSP